MNHDDVLRAKRRRVFWRYVVVLSIMFTASIVAAFAQTRSRSHDAPGDAATVASHTSDDELHPVVIRRPDGTPRVEVEVPGGDGRTVDLACAVCHDTRDADPSNKTPAQLDEFHRDLPFDHGNLTCVACHAPPSYGSLRLADGETVSYSDVMTLCSQCHGGIRAAYDRGAHGGMNGYWDLSRGPRVRNNCIDCHDPHVPAFPQMIPTFKTQDRRPVGHPSSSHDIGHDRGDSP